MAEIKMSVLYEIFGLDDAMLSLAEDILSRYIDMNDEDEYDRLYQAMDEGLIYTADQWEMIKYYCTPANADFNNAWDDFTSDLMKAIHNGAIEEDE